ncbi:hypothetical protein DFH06DRAFT_1129337 [Mycena polygramma]|nr:hypothetical protein DFH06DRAFT_1129337 [Mycena polygramma]
MKLVPRLLESVGYRGARIAVRRCLLLCRRARHRHGALEATGSTGARHPCAVITQCRRELHKAGDAVCARQRAGWFVASLQPRFNGYGRCAGLEGPPTRRMPRPVFVGNYQDAARDIGFGGGGAWVRQSQRAQCPVEDEREEGGGWKRVTQCAEFDGGGVPYTRACHEQLPGKGSGERNENEGHAREQNTRLHAQTHSFYLSPWPEDVCVHVHAGDVSAGAGGRLGDIQNQFREQARSYGLDAADAAARGSRRKAWRCGFYTLGDDGSSQCMADLQFVIRHPDIPHDESVAKSGSPGSAPRDCLRQASGT